MKIAARFPIKNCPELLLLCAALHLTIAIAVLFAALSWWLSVMIVIAVIISWKVTLKHYSLVTTSSGDLCWSGESWLIANDSATGQIDYLQLKPTSWITSQFSLLKFDLESQEKVWFFTCKHLGERSYRELCYLAHQDLHLSSKNQD